MEENMSLKGRASLAVHEDSHGISKSRPKVRIVHIFAPEIIKTDVANFRELVQRLTGKPTKRSKSKKKARPAMAGAPGVAVAVAPTRVEVVGSQHRYRDSWLGDVIKQELEGVEEVEMWMDENSDGFFDGLKDKDGFFQGLGDFPLLPLSSSHMDVMGEVHTL